MNEITKNCRASSDDKITVSDPMIHVGVKVVVYEGDEHATILLTETDALQFADTLFASGIDGWKCAIASEDKLEVNGNSRRVEVIGTMDGVSCYVFLETEDAQDIAVRVREKYLGEPEPEFDFDCGGSLPEHLITAGDGATLDLEENLIGETVLEARYEERVVYVRIDPSAAEDLIAGLGEYLNDQPDRTVSFVKRTKQVTVTEEQVI